MCRKTELEYEFLYNLRDQALLFLKMQPETDGYVNEIMARLDEMVDALQEGLAKECVNKCLSRKTP